MKFFRYKQVCRLNFFGYDDELNGDVKGCYNTPFKLINDQSINTKLLRFRIDNLKNIKLSQNAKLVVESCFIPTVYTPQLIRKHSNIVKLRLKNLNDTNAFDSSNDNNDHTVIFSGNIHGSPSVVYDTLNNQIDKETNMDAGIGFINPCPETLYNFTVTQNFLNSQYVEFEIIYSNVFGQEMVFNADTFYFQKFQCSLVIYDVEEEQLLSSAGNEVNYKKFGEIFPLKSKF